MSSVNRSEMQPFLGSTDQEPPLSKGKIVALATTVISSFGTVVAGYCLNRNCVGEKLDGCYVYRCMQAGGMIVLAITALWACTRGMHKPRDFDEV